MFNSSYAFQSFLERFFFPVYTWLHEVGQIQVQKRSMTAFPRLTKYGIFKDDLFHLSNVIYVLESTLLVPGLTDEYHNLYSLQIIATGSINLIAGKDYAVNDHPCLVQGICRLLAQKLEEPDPSICYLLRCPVTYLTQGEVEISRKAALTTSRMAFKRQEKL